MRAVFHPFWLGRHGCAGKSLAIIQLKTVTAAVVRRFEFTLVGELEEVSAYAEPRNASGLD
jgi:cytochrome P450